MKTLTYNQKQEIFAGIRCGFQQYLREVKGWTYDAIASYFSVTNRTVWNHCNGDYTIKAFDVRTAEEIANYERIFNLYF
jgi:hypothetical protein